MLILNYDYYLLWRHRSKSKNPLNPDVHLGPPNSSLSPLTVDAHCSVFLLILWKVVVRYQFSISLDFFSLLQLRIKLIVLNIITCLLVIFKVVSSFVLYWKWRTSEYLQFGLLLALKKDYKFYYLNKIGQQSFWSIVFGRVSILFLRGRYAQGGVPKQSDPFRKKSNIIYFGLHNK